MKYRSVSALQTFIYKESNEMEEIHKKIITSFHFRK